MRTPQLESERGIFQAIGQAVRDARKRKGISQQELARRVELSRPAITSIETGYSGCTITNLYAIADGLGVPVYSLLPQSKVAQTTNAEKRIAELETKLLNVYELAETIVSDLEKSLPSSLTRAG